MTKENISSTSLKPLESNQTNPEDDEHLSHAYVFTEENNVISAFDSGARDDDICNREEMTELKPSAVKITGQNQSKGRRHRPLARGLSEGARAASPQTSASYLAGVFGVRGCREADTCL